MELIIGGVLLFIFLYIIYYLFDNYGFSIAYVVSALIIGLIVIIKYLNAYADVSDLIINVLYSAAIVLGVTIFEYIIYRIGETFLTYLMLICLFLLLAYAIALKVTGIAYNVLIFEIVQKMLW